VTAKYNQGTTEETTVLQNLTFSIYHNEKIGVLGRTGAGKSSIIKLFWLSLTPDSGEILVDGINIVETDLK
jgi:ABC-type multidrug transport system fused ATPase/permease subunit